MKISNRVKRNITFALTIVGVVCIVARTWGVILAPSSRQAWFELVSILFLTFLCFSDFLSYSRRVKKGVMFGSEQSLKNQEMK